jgi:hypothetical protein
VQQSISLKGTGLVLEQDVTVSVVETKDVKLEVGDEVHVLVRAEVINTYGGGEVDLGNLSAVKVTGVTRKKNRRAE